MKLLRGGIGEERSPESGLAARRQTHYAQGVAPQRKTPAGALEQDAMRPGTDTATENAGLGVGARRSSPRVLMRGKANPGSCWEREWERNSKRPPSHQQCPSRTPIGGSKAQSYAASPGSKDGTLQVSRAGNAGKSLTTQSSIRPGLRRWQYLHSPGAQSVAFF